MVIRFQDGSLPTSPSLIEHARRCLERAARPAAGRIREVVVWVRDINANRGGIDKECRMVASVDGYGQLTVESRTRDFHEAIVASAEKLRRVIDRRLHRTAR
jgi:putative sigma-54 modulation protein